MPEPRGDLVRQKNCNIETYQGGQSCCHHKWILLDENQTQPLGDMTYRLKFAFIFKIILHKKNGASLLKLKHIVENMMFQNVFQELHQKNVFMELQLMAGADMVDHDILETQEVLNLFTRTTHWLPCIDVELYNSDIWRLIMSCRWY